MLIAPHNSFSVKMDNYLKKLSIACTNINLSMITAFHV